MRVNQHARHLAGLHAPLGHPHTCTVACCARACRRWAPTGASANQYAKVNMASCCGLITQHSTHTRRCTMKSNARGTCNARACQNSRCAATHVSQSQASPIDLCAWLVVPPRAPPSNLCCPCVCGGGRGSSSSPLPSTPSVSESAARACQAGSGRPGCGSCPID